MERDTDSSTVLAVDDADISIQAARDILNVAMVFEGIEYAILGLENQDYIHYALPFKTEGYDVYSYDRQYKQKKSYYKTTKELTGDERMSGIKKTDRFIPVVTVVIYYGSEPWDGPTCLYDMLNLPEELKPFVNNFKVNLVETRDNNLIFHNQNNKDLFTLLKIISNNSVDTKTRRKQIHAYETAHKIDKSVRMAIAATSKVNLKKYGEESDATMCKLWDDIKNEGREEGKAEAIIEFMMEDSSSDNEIIGALQKRMSITEITAENYLKSYRENKR